MPDVLDEVVQHLGDRHRIVAVDHRGRSREMALERLERAALERPQSRVFFTTR
jgi:hypothetical protein